MMVLENMLSHEIVQRLGWTLLHFIWQATAAALLLTVLLAALRKSSSSVRYIIACMAMGLIVLLPVATFQLVPVAVPEQPKSPQPAPAPVVLPTEQVNVLPAVEVPAMEPPARIVSEVSIPSVPWRQRVSDNLEAALPHVVAGWLIGVFALSIWNLGGWTQLQRLRRKMVGPVDVSLLEKLDELAEKLGVRRAVQLTESALVQIPTVVGWLRPVILLPASALTGLTTEQLDAILAHELAHIRRHDYLVNMLQTIVETLGFYHPAVWWVSHKIRTEREHCCDDLAIVVTGDRVRYARALTSMEEIRGRNSELAVTATGGNLFARIHRLIGRNSDEKTFGWIPAVTVILLLVALIFSTTIALTTNENEPSNAEKSDSGTKVLIETQTVHVNNELLEQVGLDADSLKNSNSWAKYRVDDSANPSMFVIDSDTKDTLLKNVDESEGSSSLSRIYMMGVSGREAIIKKNSGYKFKSQELGRFIQLKPTISQDGQSTYLDCKLMMRQFKDINLFLDVYINKKVDQNDVSESEIVENQIDSGNILLPNDNTVLILGGKLVSFQDVENGVPVLKNLPLVGRLFNTTSKIKVEKNEILLIKTSIIPPERSDDVDSKASSYNVAKYIGTGFVKGSELLRVYLDLHLEPGQYVEIKDSGQREAKFRQVTTRDIGKSGKDFPAYAGYIDFQIRSNFDLNLATKRYTRGSFFEHDKWDAYFTGPDTIIGNGRFSPTTLCASTWRVKLYKSVAADVDIIPSLVAVIIKPSNQPQEPSTEDKPAGTAAEQSDVHVEGEASESPVWVTFLPKSPIRSLKEYSHTYRTSPPPAPPLYKPVPMPDCELEIRRAADQTRVARIPHGGSFGVNGFTKQARQRIGQLPDGEYLLAFCAGDKRCSNVAILVLDSDYDPSREPTLGLIPLPMGPGQTLPLFGIRAVGPTPQDSQLMNDSIAFPTLVVDGMERTLSQMTWVGPVGPLKSGGVYTSILTLDDYEPAIKSGRKHTIKAVVGKYESTRVVIPADDILGRQWDKSTENQPPIQPPKVVLQGGVIRSDGKIGAGYEVHIFGQNGERYNAFSDKDGKYSFSNIPSGEYKVVCNPKGKGQPGLTIESVMVNPNKTLILNLGLERKYSFAGRIRYEDGKPATGIDVALTCQDTDTNAEFINFTITDVNGNYELGGPFGNVSYIGINGRRIRGTMPKLKPGITELYYVLKKNAQGKYIGLPAERPTEIPGVQVDEEKSAEDRSEFESAEIEPNEPMVSLNFRNVDLKTIIAKLADWTGKTIIPTAEATKLKMTTYAPKKMPQSKAVALILTALRMKGCVVEETDYAIVILRMPEEDPGKASTGSDESATEGIDKSQVVQKFYRLQNYSPTEMGRTIKPLLSNAGKQRADEESSTLLIIDTVENLERIEKTIEQLDKPETRQFPIFVGEKEYEIVQLGYADVNEVTERLNQAIQQMPDKEMRQKVLVQPLPRAKQIIIFGREDLREMVKKLIMEIDIPSRLFETRVFKLKYANADRIKENIEAIYEPLTDGVKAISYPEMHQVTVIASSGNMLKVADKIAEWDVPLDLDRLKPRIITLRNSDPAQMAELLTSTFAGEGGGEGDIYEVIFGKDILEKRKTTGPLSYQLNFEGVPGTRKIIVISNFPEAYDVVEKLILELDKQKMATKNVKQVRQWIDRLAGEGRLGGSKTSDHKILIETRILSVTDDFLEEIELDANSVRTSEMWSEYLLADSTAEPNSPQYQLLLDELSAGLLTKAVATHKGTGKGNEMLATPQVIAADGKQAIIKVVNLMATEKPVVAGPSDTNDLSSKAESKLKFVEVGTSIRLTPDVLPDGGNVRLDFEWELSQVRGFEERTGPDKKKLKVPLLAVDTIKTTTVVPDGKTLLIGGKKISRWTLTESRKPILGDLPLVGYIFRSDSMIEDTKNILILVKPAIVQPKPTASPPIPPLEPDDPLPKKLQEKLESPTAPK